MGQQALETFTLPAVPVESEGAHTGFSVGQSDFLQLWLPHSCTFLFGWIGNHGTLCSCGSVRAPSRRVCLFAQGGQPVKETEVMRALYYT